MSKKIQNTVDSFGIPLNEDMAFTRQHALQELEELQFNIAIHLILLFLLPDSRESRGWLKELNAWRKKLARLDRGKGGKSNFKTKDLILALWEQPLGEPSDRAYRIKEIYNEKKMLLPTLEPHLKDFKKFVEKYISSIDGDIPFKP